MGAAPQPVVVIDTVSLWTKGWSKKRSVDLYQRSEDSRYNATGGYAGYPRVVTGYLALSLDNTHQEGELREQGVKEMMNVVASLPAELTAVDVNALRAVLPDGVRLGVWNNRNFAGDWNTHETQYRAKQEQRQEAERREQVEANRRRELAALVVAAAEERGIKVDHFKSQPTARIKLTDLANCSTSSRPRPRRGSRCTGRTSATDARCGRPTPRTTLARLTSGGTRKTARSISPPPRAPAPRRGNERSPMPRPPAPFSVTPLVKEILQELVRTDELLDSHEITQCTGGTHPHVVKALMRMQQSGWVTCEQTRRSVGPTFTAYRLTDEHRVQAANIVEKES